MKGQLILSEAAKAVLWLWVNDPDRWSLGSHAVVHVPTGVAVWIANKSYGLHLLHDIPERDRPSAYACNGRELRLGGRDRYVLWRLIGRRVLAERTRRSIGRRMTLRWGLASACVRTKLLHLESGGSDG